MSASAELASLFRRDLTRLTQQLAAFPDDGSLWKTGPGIANSAGNLALHLEGNLREYIGRQLGGVAYTRQRPLEFSTKGLAACEVIERIEAVRGLICSTVALLSQTELDAAFPEIVLDVPLTVRQFLVHLLGHLNYHLGQIDYARRLLTGSGAIELARLA
ncbi:MAG: DinB family protein [Bryobacteraceae bacterium]